MWVGWKVKITNASEDRSVNRASPFLMIKPHECSLSFSCHHFWGLDAQILVFGAPRTTHDASSEATVLGGQRLCLTIRAKPASGTRIISLANGKKDIISFDPMADLAMFACWPEEATCESGSEGSSNIRLNMETLQCDDGDLR
jgi:hypothetical protein